MTARRALAVLTILAAAAAVVCVPLAVFLGAGALMVAIDARDADRRDARHRSRPVRMFQAHPAVRR